MPTTRKRVIKTVYKDEDESGQDGHDFSDSGSDAEIPDSASSDEECVASSDEDFKSSKSKKKTKRPSTVQKVNKTNFTKSFITKINKQKENEEDEDLAPVLFTVKDLTDADKLLPSILNLSESDSSDDESPRVTTKRAAPSIVSEKSEESENETESKVEYKDVWSNNIQDESEEIAKKTFLELEQHKSKMEETKMTIQNYTVKSSEMDCDVKDLLALGEEEIPKPSVSSQPKKRKKKVINDESDSEREDWEEVKEAKGIPQQGLQLVVDIPNAVCRKTKKLDIEMMMKRKINRVKKEYQVYMHKVHVLCWLAHGNYVSRVLNDQTIMATALSLVPSKECYPRERVDMKYVEQITTWYKDKVTLKQDKHENKFRPKAPPLKDILQQQVKSRIFTTKKYIVFVFVSMLRSLGLQCRVMFNFVTLPIRPPTSELCSLSTKSKDVKHEDKKENKNAEKVPKRSSKSTKASKEKIPQLDGNYDMSCSSDSDNIMQVDGNDDSSTNKSRRQRNTQNSRKHESNETNLDEGSVSPPKRPRRDCRTRTQSAKEGKSKKVVSPKKLQESDVNNKSGTVKSRKSLSLNRLETNNIVPSAPKDKKTSESTTLLVKQVETLQRTRRIKNPVNANLPKPEIQAKDGINKTLSKKTTTKIPEIVISNDSTVSSKYFENNETALSKKPVLTNKKRSKTSEPIPSNSKNDIETERRVRTKSAQGNTESKYFTDNNIDKKATSRKTRSIKKQIEDPSEDSKRVSHKDLQKPKKTKNDVTDDLIHIIKSRVKEAKEDAKKLMVKEKIKKESDEDSDYLPVQSPKAKSESDDDFKPVKITPKSKAKTIKKIDRRVISTDEELQQNSLHKIDVWCEVFVEELEEWIAVDVIKGSVHCVNEIYMAARLACMISLLEEAKREDDKIKRQQGCEIRGLRLLSVDRDYVRIFRLTEDLITIIEQDLAPFLPVERRRRGLCNRTRILCTLSFLASGGYQKFLGTNVNTHLSQSSVSRSIRAVVYALSHPSIVRKYVKFPQNYNERSTLKEKFFSKFKIPGVIGCIDGSLIAMIRPKEHEERYYCRKGYHAINALIGRATHPVTYVVGWDNNNYLKDLTRKYVPQWNTVTRKQRVEPLWWDVALKPWLGPKTARDKEEDERLDRMQLDAPLPKAIGEYKNHPLYALKRHLLKFEAIYPPDAATLGFVRGEPVYARDCVYICRSRDTWLKEAKVVKLGEQPYKVVKARPKWDRLSNKLITDKPLEVFGPWQVQDYEPPTAENGVVPRNAYGNVELFKDCMLPKGTAHLKLPGLNRVAKKLNIDCAPAMTGFDFNGGWSHPVYDGFVVCKEFEEIITEAWIKDQEDQERKEREKIEARVYGNWRRLIRGLLIKERLKAKYGFEEPSTSQDKKKKGPRLVVKKK